MLVRDALPRGGSAGAERPGIAGGGAGGFETARDEGKGGGCLPVEGADLGGGGGGADLP